MRYYLTSRGETGGPYPESRIKSWILSGQISDDATVREEFSQEWLLVRESPIFRKKPQWPILVAVSGAVAALFVVLLVIREPRRKPLTEVSVSACVLSVPGKPTVPVFPTQKGAELYARALRTGQDIVIRGVYAEYGGIEVGGGTKCSENFNDGAFASVRLLGGARDGWHGFVPLEWLQGQCGAP